MKKSNIVKALISSLGVLPLIALAQAQAPTIVNSYSGLTRLIATAGNWILGILLAAAVILILIAAFSYITAAGDETKVKKAKSMLTYAIIAIALGLLARGIVALIITFFGQSGTFTGQY